MSSLLLALFALSWALVSFVPGLVAVLPLFAVAGFVYLLLQGRAMEGDESSTVFAGAWLGLGIYAIWILFMLASMPIAIKNVGSHVPPGFFRDAAEALSPFLPIAGVIAVVVGFWYLWAVRERVLGGVGAGLVTLVVGMSIIGLYPQGDAASTVLSAMVVLGFLAVAVAAALPLVAPTDGHPARPPETA